MFHDIIDLIKKDKFEEILLTGEIETHSGFRCFNSYLDTAIYFKFTDNYIKISSNISDSKLSISIEKKIKDEVDIDDDDDDFCIASMNKVYFGDHEARKIIKVRSLSDSDLFDNSNLYNCLEIVFEGNLSLLFDPLTFHGISIEVNRSLEYWETLSLDKKTTYKKEFII